MARHFIIVWVLYWSAVAILPVHSVYPATLEAFLLQLVFVITVLMGYGVAHVLLKIPALPQWGEADAFDVKGLIKVALVLASVGTIFLIYDRVFLQGIDYSRGIAYAREEWRRAGEIRAGGVSSIFSVLGYLFSNGYFVAGILTVAVKNGLTQKFRFFSLLCVFLLLMVNSLIAGGRSNVLLLVTLLLATVSSQHGWRYQDFIRGHFSRLAISIMALLSALYTLYVFYERAEASDMTGSQYVLSFLPYLGLELDEWYRDVLAEDSFASFSSIFVLAASYITHSFSTTAAIVDGVQEDKVIVFLHLMNLLNKLGLAAQPDSSWFLAGRFPSLPGAILYQFGVFGLFSIGFLLGLGCALAKLFYVVRSGHIIPLSLYVASYAILIISPILLVLDFMSFPFVILSFVQVAILKIIMGNLRKAFRKPLINISYNS